MHILDALLAFLRLFFYWRGNGHRISFYLLKDNAA
ncbi:Uncharacterised protein [Salmonella enterica subsp. enterica]|uniref:Uncharacterized protein n=1 Tax=Salmonella enterica I TaxID=59201 RepID=A0A3S4FAM3_SALET|nr:Uncharacterised protein [Salmonella enterica subsp. enterica]